MEWVRGEKLKGVINVQLGKTNSSMLLIIFKFPCNNIVFVKHHFELFFEEDGDFTI